MSENHGDTLYLYVGTYTTGDSEGIYVYRMHPATGALELTSTADAGENPSFLAIHPQGRYLYAVNEVSEFEGKPAGSVSSFTIDQASGELTFLNRKSSVGEGPCHLIVEDTGRFVLAANYGGGSVCMLPIQDDGGLGEASRLCSTRAGLALTPIDSRSTTRSFYRCRSHQPVCLCAGSGAGQDYKL